MVGVCVKTVNSVKFIHKILKFEHFISFMARLFFL